MATRGRQEHLRHALLTALGLFPSLACGGSTTSGHAAVGGQGGARATGGSATSGSTSGGSTSGGGVFNAAGGALAGGSSTARTCDDPVPLDSDGNQVSCKGGWVRRVAPATCPTRVPRPEPVPSLGPFDACSRDADCGPNEFCAPGASIGNVCQRGCVTDADCAASWKCLCGEPMGVCVESHCAGDQDCAPGHACASLQTTGCGIGDFLCQTAEDQCVAVSDCPPDSECWFNGQFRECQHIYCTEGRPFLVDDEQRCAPETERSDWSASFDSLEEDPWLAERWTRTALAEHASVAAFARFTLQLMALGAPAELVSAATAAQRDEVEHARICFALASAYAGRAVGPGALDVSHCLAQTSLEHCMLTAFLEGAIGETGAALEAAEAAAAESDTRIRAVLEQIAADEARHAELAFRFIAWALQREPNLRASLLDAMQREAAQRSVVFDAVTRPCLEALLCSRRRAAEQQRAHVA